MKKPSPPPPGPADLRSEALERLGRSNFDPGAQSKAARLLHELEVHRIELEMQNEQLRVAQHELEAGLDRYTQLFDFAPIGYATLGIDGVVREVNHVGATLLREPRARIVGKQFSLFLAGAYRSGFQDLLQVAARDNVNKTIDAELTQ